MSTDNLVIALAELGGIGSIQPGAGAIAILLGTIWFWFLQKQLHRWHRLIVGSQLAIAVVVAGLAEIALTLKDPSQIVIDEFAALPLTFILLKPNKYPLPLLVTIVAVLLYGLLDSLKPLGIASIETIPYGIGVVADDAAAATVAGLILTLLLRFTHKGTA